MNDPVEVWANKMESNFDVEVLERDLEIEEKTEEISRKCEICDNIYVVKKEYEFADKEEFICPYCILILANMANK